jgi:MSHA biogenesis protein MshO
MSNLIKFVKARTIKQLGFTLVEMVIVIVLLGILSVGITGFIKLGSQVYLDVSNRDEIIASARFAVERLNRELRHALPNSIRVTSNGSCLEFTPVLYSVSYLDIPVAPEPASVNFTVVQQELNYSGNLTHFAVVYPSDFNAADVYDLSRNKRKAMSTFTPTIGASTWTLASSSLFAEDSPTERLFIVHNPVSYCVVSTALFRYDSYGFTTNQLSSFSSGNSAKMADFIKAGNQYFSVASATQTRNSLVSIRLPFSRNGEEIEFANEVQVLNVP